VNLPAAYVRAFVQHGYATTEHGNQGVTTDESITLVTGTTTGRGELKLFRQDDTGLTGAVDTWRRWAAGHPMASTDLDAAAHELSCYVATTSEARALLATLAPDHPVLRTQARAIDRTEVDYGIEL
jgi:hypothetical protein